MDHNTNYYCRFRSYCCGVDYHAENIRFCYSGPRSSDFITYRILENASKYIPFMPDFSAESFNVKILNINMITQFMTYISTSFAFAILFPSLILYTKSGDLSVRLCMKMK